MAAVIINNRVKVWHYLPRRWCGAAASDLYKDVVYPAMRRCRGAKATYRIVEDNDPTGYKSGAAMETKKSLGIQAVPFPKYSPDLNPLDYFLWAEVSRRVAAHKAPRAEGAEAFKARLRRTAMAIPASVIKAAVAKMRPKAAEVVSAGGGRIKSD